jgi:hypothetical protein
MAGESRRDRRSKEFVKDFLRTMRRRGHSRAEVLSMIDSVELEVCSNDSSNNVEEGESLFT